MNEVVDTEFVIYPGLAIFLSYKLSNPITTLHSFTDYKLILPKEINYD